ncbi:MAG: hypothetical protein A2161_07535 [Candidatus Schekmanbacteria bacterium RBG_13_48_7]|uniref:IgA Peptidase M64 n=1 Tax=Candidatus Schekmanbacteria bacterium RBG_13_48_7 TaxID=1817878 RepID=A0A1F7RJM2_9BACT|nr:MAG: hypothetical protein A2161_07535 [Candidatus Schekmanbacteria bacterium RBG_13_48_7]
MGTYRDDVDADMAYLLSMPPYSDFYDHINIHRIDNTDDLGCFYDCEGIPRLICCDHTAVFAAAASAPFDELIVLVNNSVYAGTGLVTVGGGGRETYAITYNRVAEYGREVMIHEFGHSFGGLMDEYEYGYPTGTIMGPNCDFSGCSAWSTVPGMGCFPGCSYDNLYRPTDSGCIMRVLGVNYCDVCKNHLIKLLSSYE